MSEKKICTKCREVKPLAEFHLHKYSRDGRKSQCRACCVASCKQWRGDNRERIAAYKKRERVVAYNKNWQAENPGYATAANKKWREENPVQHRARAMQRRARERAASLGLPYDLPPGHVEGLMHAQDCRCIVCGKKLDPKDKTNGTVTSDSPSLDRVFPELGYVVANVAVLCHRCNTLKSNGTLDEFRAILAHMYRHEPVRTP